MTARNGNGAAPAAAPTALAPTIPPTGSEAPASVSIRVRLRGHDVMLTLRGPSGADVLPKTLAALDWLEAHGAEPSTSTAGRGRSRRPDADPNAPKCPDHGGPMLKGRKGFYCPRKDEAGGYCKRTA